MIKHSMFRQREVYANLVPIHSQNRKIYGKSTEMNELRDISCKENW